MNWKEFLKPNRKKAVYTAILLVATALLALIPVPMLVSSYYCGQFEAFDPDIGKVMRPGPCPNPLAFFAIGIDFSPGDYPAIGFPIIYYSQKWLGYATTTEGHINIFGQNLNPLNFIVDVGFWYLIACAIVLKKGRSKRLSRL